MSDDAIDKAVREAQASSLRVFRDVFVEMFADAPAKYETLVTVQDVIDVCDMALAAVVRP